VRIRKGYIKDEERMGFLLKQKSNDETADQIFRRIQN
jgi:hypothetical protein